MSRRPLLFAMLLVGFLLLCVFTTVVVLRSRIHPHVNRHHYERIEAGMSQQEVEGILRGKGEELGSLATVEIASDERFVVRFPPPHEPRTWRGEWHQISVLFDLQGRVAAKEYERDQDAPMWVRLIDALGW